MLLAYKGIIPPKEWNHDPNIKNKKNKTVADILKENHIPLPNEWYDDKMKYVKRNPKFI